MSWTTQQLAEAANLTDRHVRFLIKHDQIKAERFGRAWMIEDEEAQRFLKEHAAKASK